METKSKPAFAGYLRFLGWAGIIFAFLSVVHYFSPDYMIELPYDGEPVNIEIPPGDSVKIKVSIYVTGGFYRTKGIRFLFDKEDPALQQDIEVFSGRYDPFPLQISSRPSGPSRTFTLEMPDNAAYTGQTMTARISGDLQVPVIVDSGVYMERTGTYEDMSIEVNVPINIMVTEKTAGFDPENIYLSVPYAITLFILCLPALGISRVLQRR